MGDDWIKNRFSSFQIAIKIRITKKLTRKKTKMIQFSICWKENFFADATMPLLCGDSRVSDASSYEIIAF